MSLKNNTRPLVSVIIANYNGEKFLTECLNSLLREKSSDFEVIIVDDASTDKSIALLKNKFGREKRLKLVALTKNVGAAKARNMGVENSSGKYLFFLDNDTKTKRGWLDVIPMFFSTNKKTGIAQAKILKMGTNRFDYAGDCIGPFGFLIERARSAKDKGQFDKEENIFALKSAAMIARRDVFNELKGFDSDYKIFWEDTDIAWRTWLLGYRVLFAPKITVWHAYGTKEKNSRLYIRNQVIYRGCKNNITTLIKNLGPARLVATLPINVGCWIILAILFLLRPRPIKSLAIIRAILWNVLFIPQVWRKRSKIQKNRKINDKELFSLVSSKKNIYYYLGKGLAYITGKPF